MKKTFLLLILAILSNLTLSQNNEKNQNNIKNFENFENCAGTKNTEPVISQTWKKEAQTSHGQKFFLKKDKSFVTLLNVTGSPFQMGQAYGELLAPEIKANCQEMEEYLEDKFAEILSQEKFVPKFLLKYLAEIGVGAVGYLLDLNYVVALPYIPDRYIQEMQGIAEGANIDFQQIKRLNMFPELIKAACSIVGAYQKSTLNNKLLTLRALDWEPEAPISKYPVITVYHSNEEGSYPFANIGYAGLIGSITAVGSQGVSIQEKVQLIWEDDDHSNYIQIPSTYEGKPWTFVLRDLAQFTKTIDEMAEAIQSSARTCSIFLGIGSTASNTFELVSYTWKQAQFFNDKNLTHLYNSGHPQLDDVVYVDRRVQPSTNKCVGDILSENWGEITWETLYRDICGYHKTGNAQICVSDNQENVIYLSYANHEEKIDAYYMPPMYIDLKPFYGI